MAVPTWATSAILNYRQFYQERFKEKADTIPDEVIWNIINTVFDDTDSKEQDKLRVTVMREYLG